MKTRNIPFMSLLLFVLFFFFAEILWARPFQPLPKDTTGAVVTSKTDSTKQLANYYQNVDVKIIYSWSENEPQWYRNVRCQLIKKKGKVTELKIFLKTCTEEVVIEPRYVSFEILDHKTGKILIKEPLQEPAASRKH